MKVDILDVNTAIEEYGFSRVKTNELFSLCNQVPRKPRGKKYVLRSEFERVLGGER